MKRILISFGLLAGFNASGETLTCPSGMALQARTVTCRVDTAGDTRVEPVESIVLGTHLTVVGDHCRAEMACMLTYGCSETITRVDRPVTCGSASDLYRTGCDAIRIGSSYTRLVQFSVSLEVQFDEPCSVLSRSTSWRRCSRFLSGSRLDPGQEAADRCELEMGLPSGMTQDMVGYCCSR